MSEVVPESEKVAQEVAEDSNEEETTTTTKVSYPGKKINKIQNGKNQYQKLNFLLQLSGFASNDFIFPKL